MTTNLTLQLVNEMELIDISAVIALVLTVPEIVDSVHVTLENSPLNNRLSEAVHVIVPVYSKPTGLVRTVAEALPVKAPSAAAAITAAPTAFKCFIYFSFDRRHRRRLLF
jgi:hypothetical protein